MRNLAIAACLVLFAAPSSAHDWPTRVTYGLGGIVSGPYRVSADLVTGTVSEASTPPGAIGDGAGLRTDDLPVTKTRQLPPNEWHRLRRLAAIVWRRGPVRTQPSVVVKGRIAPPIVCNTPDALGRFDIVKDGVTRTFDFSTPCMSADGDRLLKALTCGANPDQAYCKTP